MEGETFVATFKGYKVGANKDGEVFVDVLLRADITAATVAGLFGFVDREVEVEVRDRYTRSYRANGMKYEQPPLPESPEGEPEASGEVEEEEPTAPATGMYFCDGCLKEFPRLVDEPLPAVCPKCGGAVKRTLCDICAKAGECERVGLHLDCPDHEAEASAEGELAVELPPCRGLCHACGCVFAVPDDWQGARCPECSTEWRRTPDTFIDAAEAAQTDIEAATGEPTRMALPADGPAEELVPAEV